MAMLCPMCKTATFREAALEENLSAEECATCGGHWLTSARYFAFLGEGGRAPPSATPSGPAVDAAPDTSTMKMCPFCSKFMRHYPVGHGLAFGIDKCGTCGGVWLEKGEYQALKARRMHRQIHAVSSDAWQFEVARRQREEAEIAAMIKRIGPADYQEVRRIVEWLAAHPHRDSLAAYVREQLHQRGVN